MGDSAVGSVHEELTVGLGAVAQGGVEGVNQALNIHIRPGPSNPVKEGYAHQLSDRGVVIVDDWHLDLYRCFRRGIAGHGCLGDIAGAGDYLGLHQECM